MDIGLYGRVIWRHKLVVFSGVILAVVLAALSYVRIDANGVSYRGSEQWVSYETISVTQPGFEEGRLNQSGADPSRLTLLATLYSKNIFDADGVRHTHLARRARVPGEVPRPCRSTDSPAITSQRRR